MSDKYISRKSFLKYAALIAAAPAVLSNISCSEQVTEPTSDKFEKALKEAGVFHNTSSGAAKVTEGGVYWVPKSTVVVTDVMGAEKCFVLRKVVTSSADKLQYVTVQHLSTNASLYLIKGIDDGDELYKHPTNLIRNLFNINKNELKKRIIKIKRGE